MDDLFWGLLIHSFGKQAPLVVFGTLFVSVMTFAVCVLRKDYLEQRKLEAIRSLGTREGLRAYAREFRDRQWRKQGRLITTKCGVEVLLADKR